MPGDRVNPKTFQMDNKCSSTNRSDLSYGSFGCDLQNRDPCQGRCWHDRKSNVMAWAPCEGKHLLYFTYSGWRFYMNKKFSNGTLNNKQTLSRSIFRHHGIMVIEFWNEHGNFHRQFSDVVFQAKIMWIYNVSNTTDGRSTMHTFWQIYMYINAFGHFFPKVSSLFFSSSFLGAFIYPIHCFFNIY